MVLNLLQKKTLLGRRVTRKSMVLNLLQKKALLRRRVMRKSIEETTGSSHSDPVQAAEVRERRRICEREYRACAG